MHTKNVEIHMREEGTKVYGKLNNFKSFANTIRYLKTEYRLRHSFLATHCCHHVLLQILDDKIVPLVLLGLART